MSNRSIVEKADLAVANLISDGGYLNPEQSNQFLDIIIDQPTILSNVRTVQMNAPKRKIEKLGFANRILRAATSATALSSGDRSKPDLELIELETDEIIAEIWLPYDVLEDNIERQSLEDTIMQKIGERAALDLEELLILGDTGSGDSYLALKDGLLQMTPSANIVDASAQTNITKSLFKQGIHAMAMKYQRNLGAMSFYTNLGVETEYRDSLADRATGLGDNLIQGHAPVFAYGVPVTPCALMPRDEIIFTYPSNVVWGVQRDIMIETDRDIRSRVLIIVLTMRIDFKLEEEDACVRLSGFSDASISTTTTTTTTTT